MKKSLYLIRHAKSSWSDPDLADHDRPLNSRGLRDKEVMSKFIRSHFSDIEIIFSSSACRALDYALSIHRHTNIPLNVEERLYTFKVRPILQFVFDLPDSYKTVALIGHNPAMTEAVNLFARLKPEKKIVNLPTAAIVKIEFETTNWSSIGKYSGAVVDFAKPKNLDSYEDDLD
ncbi:MAG: histidine phosphatase family protein [Gammaproteobacteria bacterium]|nr:histidine phosphatase family protein [Gammaproteobacteria bacterium]